jgi:hypothetical protein
MGKGRFFSYIESNRRFALQQVIENHEMTSKKFRAILVELGQTVAATYPEWSTSAWKDAGNPAKPSPGGEAKPTQEAAASKPGNSTGPVIRPGGVQNATTTTTGRPAARAVSGKPKPTVR